MIFKLFLPVGTRRPGARQKFETWLPAFACVCDSERASWLNDPPRSIEHSPERNLDLQAVTWPASR
jgi:hypothetical protein